jgi:hypothetical protein
MVGRGTAVGIKEKPQVAIRAPLSCRSPVVPGPARGEVELFFRTSRGPRLLAVLGLTPVGCGGSCGFRYDVVEVEPAPCRGVWTYERPKLPPGQRHFLLHLSLLTT